MNIHAASDKYSGAVWSATFRIKSAFYMENGVDFEAFKANENVKTFVNAFVKESRRRWKNNDSNKNDMMRLCPYYYAELVPDFPIEDFENVVPNLETPEAQPHDVEMVEISIRSDSPKILPFNPSVSFRHHIRRTRADTGELQ